MHVRMFCFAQAHRRKTLVVSILTTCINQMEHPWENPAEREGAQHHAWDLPGLPDCGDSESDSDDEKHDDSPGEKLVSYLVGLYIDRVLNAQHLCTALFYASGAKIKEADECAYRPDADSGKYQEHLNAKMSFLKEKHLCYKFPIPTFDKKKLEVGTCV